MRSLILVAFAAACPAQTTFPVASVKPSQKIVGKDWGDRITFNPNGFTGRNVTLKTLIVEAYHLQPFQVTGGPNWLDTAEYEVDARTGESAGRDEVRLMLRTLLADRFVLALHRESKEMKVYELVVDKSGAKIQAARGDGTTMQQFANLLAVKLTIPVMDDPGKPGMARGTQTPVLDKTGLRGVYNIPADIRPEPGSDMFTLWQRVLREQLGLKLQSAKSQVEVLVVDHAERTPSAN